MPMANLCLDDKETLCTAEEAKTCPFCGELPAIRPWHGGGIRKRLVSCVNLECPLQPSITGSTRRQALAKWNTRA